jgi:ribosomal protein S18 acetylase RimI-like enzyme
MTAVRQATPTDQARVEEIVRAAYQPWVEVIGMRPLPMEADYAALTEAGQVWLLDDGLIVLAPEDGVLLVENVAVHPDAQGRGLGRRLLAFAEERARLLGLPELRLYTNLKMLSNIALYERLGYVREAEESIQGRHAVHMRKRLPGA